MNTLNADLTNRVVVVLAVVIGEARQDLMHRLFLVQGGEDASAGPDETKFYGRWLAKGPNSLQDSLRRPFVERLATEEEIATAKREYGWPD
jgi:hypothetical protein